MHYIPLYITLYIVYGIIPNYLPILLRGHGYSPGQVGIFLAIAEGFGILGPFLFGKFTDKHGRYKGSIICAYALIAAASLPLAFFVHPAVTAILASLLMLGFRSESPLIDAITTINLGEKGNYGKIRVSGSIAYVCTLFLLQWIPVLRPDTPRNISVWIFITVLPAIAAAVVLPPGLSKRIIPADSIHPGNINKKSIWTPVFIAGLVCIILSRLAMTSVYSFFSLFLVDYVHWDAVGLMWGLSGLAEIPFLYFSHRVIRRFGAMPILAFTSAMVALRLGLYAIFPVKAGLIAGQLLHCFCFGLFHPAAIEFISANVPAQRRSFGMTLYLSVGCGLPLLIGNFLGGLIADHAGYRALFGYFSVFAVLGAVVYFVYQKKSFPRSDRNPAVRNTGA